MAAGEERLQFLMQTQHRLCGRLDKLLIDPKEGDRDSVILYFERAILRTTPARSLPANLTM
jgi:hypothetical protein